MRQVGISATHHRRRVEACLLLLKAQLLSNRRDRSVKIFAHDGMGLKVIGLAAHNLDKAVVLRTNLDAGLVEVYQLLAALKMLAEGTAAMELAVLVEHARDERRVGTRACPGTRWYAGPLQYRHPPRATTHARPRAYLA